MFAIFHRYSRWICALTTLVVLVTSIMPIGAMAASQAAETFITSVIASSSSVQPGQTVTLNAVVTAPSTGRVLVDLEIFDSSGNKVHQQFLDDQEVTAGVSRSFPFNWEVPAAQAHGTYLVSLGIMKPGWEEQLTWHAGAVTLEVSDNASRVVALSASATPNPVTTGEAVQVSVQAKSSSELTDSVVEITVYNAAQFVVSQQRYTDVAFNANEEKPFALLWTVPRGIQAGEYRVGAEVLSHDRHVSYSKETNLALLQVVSSQTGPTPGRADTYETSAIAIPEQVTAGSLLDIRSKVKPSSDSLALVDVEIYNPSGAKVHQMFFDEQFLDDEFVSAYPLLWKVPADAELGTYVIRMGIFKPGWGEQYSWNSEAGSFVVSEETQPEDTTPPSVPSNLQATPGDGQISLDWTAVPELDLSHYNVHVSLDKGVTWTSMFNVGLSTSYTILGLENGSEYTFAVSAVDYTGNESAKSSAVPSTPVSSIPTETIEPPTLKQIIPQNGGRVIVIWEPVNDAALAGHKLYVSKDRGVTWNEPIPTLGKAAFFPLEGLTPDQHYTIALTSVDTEGKESVKSNRKTTIPTLVMDRTAPEAPVGLQAVPGDAKVTLAWNESLEGDLQTYTLYMKGNDGSAPARIASTQEKTTFIKTDLENGVKYTFYVTAQDMFGNESVFSAPVEATPLREADATPPPIPIGVKAVAGNKKVDLSWDGSIYANETDFAGFKVYVFKDGAEPYVEQSSYNHHIVLNLEDDTTYAFKVTAYDTSGNESAPSEAVEATTPAGPDETPPAVPTDLKAVDVNGDIILSWSAVSDQDLSHYQLYISDSDGVTWQPAISVGKATNYTVTTLASGKTYVFALTSVDLVNNESPKSETASVSYASFVVPERLKVQPGVGKALLTWDPIVNERLAGYRVYVSSDNGVNWSSPLDAGTTNQHTVEGLTNGDTYTFAVTAISTNGKESEKSDTAIGKLAEDVFVPADPIAVAPLLSHTGRTSFADRVSFLYEGTGATQAGVQAGAIDENRVTVIRGKVLDTQGQPLSGVKITVHAQSEVGRTYSRADGQFDIAANSSSTVTVQYEKTGYMTIQRKAETSPLEFSFLPEAVMTALDTKVTEIETNGTDYQIAEANPVTDQDGTRQASLLFAPGTTATMKLDDGTVKELASLNVRATEYTVGELGQEAMPGELTNMVAYTYAVELSVDEAIAAGAKEVAFNKPVYVYVDNFLNHPAGIIVPNGYYNRSTGAWEAQEDGVVIKVVKIENGIAYLDVDGDNVIDGEDKLSQLDLPEAETVRLASLFSAGESFWRVPVNHFSPFDFNQVRAALPEDYINPPYVAPELKEKWFKHLEDKLSPKTPDKKDEPIECKEGSIIGCEQQSLGQEIDIEGTPFKLTYDSKRSVGYQDKNTIKIPITDSRELPQGLIRIELDFYIAGKKISQTFGLEKNQKFELVWDGTDAFGRPLIGKHPYFSELRYIYKNDIEAARRDYNDPDKKSSVFGRIPGGNVADAGGGVANTLDTEYVNGRDEIAVKQEWNGYIESPTSVFQDMGIAGWKLSDHQFLKEYDTFVVEDWTALLPSTYTLPVGAFAQHMVYGKDGNMYYTIAEGPYNDIKHAIYRITSNGIKEKVHESAVEHEVIAVGSDGTMFTISGLGIYRKLPHEANLVYFAGGGQIGLNDYEDGTLATEVTIKSMNEDSDPEVGPDGSLYFKNYNYGFKLNRIDPNGRIYAMFAYKTYVNNRLAERLSNIPSFKGTVTKRNFGSIGDFKIGNDGTIYTTSATLVCATDTDGCKEQDLWETRSLFRSISPSGEIKHIAGKKRPFDYASIPYWEWYIFAGVGLVSSVTNGMDAKEAVLKPRREFQLDDSGNIYVMEMELNRIYMITPEGVIHPWDPETVEKIKSIAGPNALNVDADLRMSVQPDGTVYFWTGSKWLKVSKAKSTSSAVVVPDSTGSVGYKFDSSTGRHLQTVLGLNGEVLVDYSYDAEGRLVRLKDSDGSEIVLERDASGVPQAIVSPNGQRTELLIVEGQLREVTNSLGETYSMTYDSLGLMKSFTDPESNKKSYEYDDKGFLVKAVTPELGEKRLARTELEDGHIVTFTDPDNRVSKYQVKYSENEMSFIATDPAGQSIVTTTNNDGTVVATYPDGSTSTTKMAVDPQWGMAVRYPQEMKLVTANGKTSVTTMTKEVTLASPLDPLSVATTKTTVNTDGVVSLSHYDAAARKNTYTGANGELYVYTFDEQSRLVREEEGNGKIAPVEYSYDETGRLKRVTQGSQFEEYAYDAMNRIESVTDASGYTRSFGFDALNRVESVTTPEGKVYRNEYDKNGNVTKLIMPDGTEYGRSFNGNGLFEGLWLGDTLAGSTSYSAAGLKDRSILNSKREIEYIRDPGNNYLLETNDPDIQRTFGYDPQGRLEKTESVIGMDRQQFIYTYEAGSTAFKDMEWKGVAQGKFVYSYDNLANLSNIHADFNTLTGPVSFDMPIHWNADNTLSKYGPFDYKYEEVGKRFSSAQDEKMNVSVSYDSMGRVDGFVNTQNGKEVYRLNGVYNNRGLMESKTITLPDETIKYSYIYDGDGQLKTVTRSSGVEGTTVENYSYDLNKNLTSREVTGSAATIHVIGDFDQLEKVGNVSYKYDADGQLSQRGNDTFYYTVKGELLEAAIDGEVIRYGYDALGRRTSRVSDEGTTQYLYGNPKDQNQVTHSVDPSGVVTAYLYGPGGQIMAIERNNQRYYIITDQVGTPERIYDEAGSLVKKLRYDSYGILLSDSNPEFELELGYAGGIEDKETGLVRFGLRDYDPASGRWNSRDPIHYQGGQANLYAYVNNDPVNKRDPSGTSAWGGNFFMGPGGGLEYYASPEGWRICAELGFGVGGSEMSDINPYSELPANGTAIFEASGEFGIGPLANMKLGESFDIAGLGNGGSICSNSDFIGQGNIGPLTYDDEEGFSLDWKTAKEMDNKSVDKHMDNLKKFPWNDPKKWSKWSKAASGKALLKLSVKICAGPSW